MEVNYIYTTTDVYNELGKDTLQNRWITGLKLFYMDESLQTISKNKIEEAFKILWISHHCPKNLLIYIFIGSLGNQ